VDSNPVITLLFYTCIALAAALYSAVGQGGGSGYLAVMALFGLVPDVMKPAALTMNLAVSTIVWYRLYRAGQFRVDYFLPFMVTSVPAAFIGGAIMVGTVLYNVLVGAALLIAAGRLIWRPKSTDQNRAPRRNPSFAIGAGLGVLSGITGVGGGLFLAPVLIFLGWCTLPQNFALSAAFIWVNSLSAIVGYLAWGHSLPEGLPLMILAALAGTAVGLILVARVATPVNLQRILGIVLFIAAIKMIGGS